LPDRGFAGSTSRATATIKPEPAGDRSAKPTLYTSYSNAADIAYAPEGALKEGLKMVKTLREEIKRLQLGSKMREDVWMRELQRCVGLTEISCPTLTN
jgi:hypothetical protein